MIALGVVLAVLTLIAFTRIGVYARRDSRGVLVKLKIGLFWITIFPEKERRPKKAAARQKPKATPEKPAAKPKRKFKFAFWMIWELWQALKKTLARLFRAIRVDRLSLRLTAGGSDCAGAAALYGRLHMAVGSAYPLVRGLFRIKKCDIAIGLDYTLASTAVLGEIKLSVSIGRMVVFGVQSLAIFFAFYRKYRKSIGKEAAAHG